jgi:hypothetical protein
MTGLIIVLLLAVLIGGFLAWVAAKPNSFRMERSTVVAATPAKIFPLIDNFHEWVRWSPFEGIDTELKRDYSGPRSGVGCGYAWEGAKTGVGAMLITESTPSKRVLIKLDFSKPMVAHNIADFTIEPAGKGASKVTWAMYGPQPFVGKLFSTLFSMEKMVGPQFEQGLAQLKAVAESK